MPDAGPSYATAGETGARFSSDLFAPVCGFCVFCVSPFCSSRQRAPHARSLPPWRHRPAPEMRAVNVSSRFLWSDGLVTETPPQTFTLSFAQIMVALRAAVAIVAGPLPLGAPLVLRPRRALAAPLVLRLHRRLGKMMQAVAALLAYRAAHGEDPPQRRKPAPRPDAAAATAMEAPRDIPHDDDAAIPPTAAAPPEPAARPPRAPRLPGRAGWLTGLSANIAGRASQLRYLLAGPEAQALLRTSPMLVRLLHPLCRMLGVALPAELLPPRPPKPQRPPRAPRPRRRRWHPPRRADLHFLLRMGKPIPES